jgi:peptidoglycan-associated lipoprotein
MLEVISYGEERPLAQGSDESSYQQNRRVELK